MSERARRLFGEDGSAAMAKALEQPGGAQRDLFAGTAVQASELAATRGGFHSSADDPEARAAPEEGAATLDRIHTAMLLQAGGRTHALRNLVAAPRINLVTVNDLGIVRISAGETEAEPPLVFDPDAVQATPVAFQRLEPVSGRYLKEGECGSGIQLS